MAHYVAEYIQSDFLYLMKLADGRIIGFAAEFEYGTTDIEEASHCGGAFPCNPEKHKLAKWFGLCDEIVKGWTPATLEEIESLNLKKCLIGWKMDMKVAAPIQPIE